MKFTPDRWLLLVLTVAVAVLVYLRFTDEPRVEYRTQTSYTPSTSNSTYRDSLDSWREDQEKQRVEQRIDCLARQARRLQGSSSFDC